ncbi:MAG: class I tRNA ligase family protein, partial [Chloroflexales bacterium]|nr:class I tRNA ligase family protein [Chloroflexales bacterium]
NNDELVATWGNLVNRTLTNVYRNFGAVPEPGQLGAHDLALIEAVERGFGSVGELIAAARFKAALAEAMALASQVNQYLSEQEPWKVIKADRERAATVLYVALRCVDNLKLLFAPFLPFTSQRLHELLGYAGFIAAPLEFREFTEEGYGSHRVLTGDYDQQHARWQPQTLPVGQALPEPKALFKKLDEKVVAEELARMEGAPA